jgi:hypothetical protein
MQKIIVGFLALTIIGAVGIGLYDASQAAVDDPAQLAGELLSSETSATDAEAVSSTVKQAATIQKPTPAADTVGAAAGLGAGDGTGPLEQQTSQDQFADMIGDPWTGTGTITGFDQAGMFITTADGTELYVELGPSFYWQAQDVTLNVGDVVSIDGFFNGENIHAATVTTSDGGVLTVRTDEGEPLWSGGQQGGNQGAGSAAGQAGASGQQGEPVFQVDPEDWVTLTGTVLEVSGSTVTVATDTYGTLVLNLGQPRFWEEQGVTFAAGDAVSILGYWQDDDQFRPGEITNLETGDRLMLLDPNGRPLWGGPGRSGSQGQGSQGSGQGAQGGQGSQGGQGTGQGGQGTQGGGQGAQGGQGSQGGGQGGQGQGSQGGRGYRGGRG